MMNNKETQQAVSAAPKDLLEKAQWLLVEAVEAFAAIANEHDDSLSIARSMRDRIDAKRLEILAAAPTAPEQV
jgi:hypothetical protein